MDCYQRHRATRGRAPLNTSVNRSMIPSVDVFDPSRALVVAQANIGRHWTPIAFGDDKTAHVEIAITVDHKPGNVRPQKWRIERRRQMPRHRQRAWVPRDVSLKRVVCK